MAKRIRITIEVDAPSNLSNAATRGIAQAAAAAAEKPEHLTTVVYLATEIVEEPAKHPLPSDTARANKAWETRRAKKEA